MTSRAATKGGTAAQYECSATSRAMHIITSILFLAFTCFGFAAEPMLQPPITKQDCVQIETAIKKETAERIYEITRVASDTVRVRTISGPPRAPSGKGQVFTLKRTKKGWEIQKRGTWIS